MTRNRAKQAVALASCLLITGCTAAVAGHARPGAELRSAPSTSATPTPSGPPMVPANKLKSVLLTVDELQKIAGGTDLTNIGILTEPRLPQGVEPYECGYVNQAGTSLSYGRTSMTAFTGDSYTGADRTYLEQIVASYDDREINLVSAFQSFGFGWDRCPEGTPHTVFVNAGVMHYVRGPIQSSPRRIAVTITRQEQPPRTCRHVAAAKANVIAETMVCGAGDTTRQADEIVDGLLAKVPE